MSLSSPIQPSTRHRLASRPRRCCKSHRSSCRSNQNLKRSLHRNQQYSVTAITDGSGAISERYAYTAYGTPTITDASGTGRTNTAVGNRYTYTGREWDADLALYHYRARIYDSIGGRFCSRDPIGFEGKQFVLYGYVRGNPPKYWDPSGLIDGNGGGEYPGDWYGTPAVTPIPAQPEETCPDDWSTGTDFLSCTACCVKNYEFWNSVAVATGVLGYRVPKPHVKPGQYLDQTWLYGPRRCLPKACRPTLNTVRLIGRYSGILFIVEGCYDAGAEVTCATYCAAR